MKKLILLALLAVIMAGCNIENIAHRENEFCIVTELDGCEYIKYEKAYGFQHKGNCKYCAQRDSIKWGKRKAEIVELLKNINDGE